MNINVLPLTGYKSLKALNAFNALLLGLKMLPVYLKEDYVTFFESFNGKTDQEKETMLREAAAFVQLQEDEVEAIISFCTDPNGVAYTKVNMKNLNPKQLHECIVAVCMEIGRIKIDLVTEDEKKN